MTILTYDLRVVGEKDVERALASVERRFASHAVRINRTLAIGGGTVRQRSTSPESTSRAIVRSNASVLKSFDDGQRKIFESTKRYQIVHHRRALRDIEERKREEIKAIRAANEEHRRIQIGARQSFSRAIGTGTMGGVSRLASVGKMGLATLGVGGSALAASSVSEALKLDEAIRRLAVSARGPGEAGRDTEQLRKQFVRTGMDTGMAPEGVVAGVQQFVTKTGDIDTALQNMRNFATVAQATGASVEDVASTAADLAQKFDIKSAKDMGDALAVLAFQGKKGAFELRDMAAQFPEMAAAAQRAGLKGVGGMRTLGGLAQIARQSTGSGAEASTAVQMMMTQLTNKSGELHSGEALGGKRVDVFQGGDPTKDARDLPTVLAEVISKSNGNMEQLSKLFDVRGIRAVSPMITAYQEASAQAGGGKKGEEAGKNAVLAMIEDAAKSSGKFADVQKDAADVMQASSIKLEMALVELKQAFAEELMPIVVQLIPRLRDLAPIFSTITRELVDLVSFLSSHPFAGIGLVIGASIASEIAKAQLAQLVTTGIVTPLGAAGLAAGAFTASLVAAKAYIDGKFAQGDQRAADAARSAAEVNDRAAAELQSSGSLSPETRKQLAELDATQRSTLSKADALKNEGVFDVAGRAINQVTGGKRNLDEYATLARTGANSAYTDEVIRTRSLRAMDSQSGGSPVGPAEVKAKEIGEQIGQAAVQVIKSSQLNRGNSPSPVKG